MEHIPSFNALIQKSIIDNWDRDALTDYTDILCFSISRTSFFVKKSLCWGAEKYGFLRNGIEKANEIR